MSWTRNTKLQCLQGRGCNNLLISDVWLTPRRRCYRSTALHTQIDNKTEICLWWQTERDVWVRRDRWWNIGLTSEHKELWLFPMRSKAEERRGTKQENDSLSLKMNEPKTDTGEGKQKSAPDSLESRSPAQTSSRSLQGNTAGNNKEFKTDSW